MVKRFGMVIEVKPDQIEKYKTLHADSNPGVRDLLKKYGYQNFSIYLQKMPDGKYYLFNYHELEGDPSGIFEEERYKEWLKETGSCQQPLEGEAFWTEMERVFFLK